MRYEVFSNSSPKRRLILGILPSALSQLNIERSTFSLQVFASSNIQGTGLTALDEELKLISVFINRGLHLKETGIAFCHEMVHVKQLAAGKLKRFSDRFTWAGKNFCLTTKYMDRPWELQAFAKQEIIFRKSIEQ
jgi:hypothetical protein